MNGNIVTYKEVNREAFDEVADLYALSTKKRQIHLLLMLLLSITVLSSVEKCV